MQGSILYPAKVPRMFHKKSFALTLILVAVSTPQFGCGKKDEGGKKRTQIVAKVNGDEISVHQLNFQLSRVGQIPQEQTKQVSKQVLDRLVEQQLLTQKAIEAKLDRDPQVLQVLEGA